MKLAIASRLPGIDSSLPQFEAKIWVCYNKKNDIKYNILISFQWRFYPHHYSYILDI